MTPGENKYTSAGNAKIKIDPNAQLAFEKLVEREHLRKRRQKIVRFLIVLLFILVALPWSFGFYCSNFIGTNFETIIILKYPKFTDKMIRAAVITDSLFLNVFGPILETINSKEDIELRRAVIELGLETTSDKESDSEKVQNLRAVVAAALLKSPGGIAFAVYEHPPRKKIPPQVPATLFCPI
jgi:hypothetical protein